MAQSGFMNERVTFRFAPALGGRSLSVQYDSPQHSVGREEEGRGGGSDVTGDGVGVICESERKERRRSWRRRRKRIRKRGGFGIEKKGKCKKKKKDWGHGEVGYLLLVTHGNRRRWAGG